MFYCCSHVHTDGECGECRREYSHTCNLDRMSRNSLELDSMGHFARSGTPDIMHRPITADGLLLPKTPRASEGTQCANLAPSWVNKEAIGHAFSGTNRVRLRATLNAAHMGTRAVRATKSITSNRWTFIAFELFASKSHSSAFGPLVYRPLHRMPNC